MPVVERGGDDGAVNVAFDELDQHLGADARGELGTPVVAVGDTLRSGAVEDLVTQVAPGISMGISAVESALRLPIKPKRSNRCSIRNHDRRYLWRGGFNGDIPANVAGFVQHMLGPAVGLLAVLFKHAANVVCRNISRFQYGHKVIF